MRNAQFDEIVNNLTPDNFDVLRGYILDVVRAEYGPLIQQLQEAVADPGVPEEPEKDTEPEMPEDPFVTQAPTSLVDFLRSIGLIDAPPRAQRRVIHLDLRF
jgi:hypothetical protein